MKISVLTPTYNRAKMLDRLYVSLIVNKNNSNIDIEWLIMDDGSTDETSTIINHYIGEKIIDIKYYKQVNQGKMTAINNLVDKATGDYIIECDSDDYFANDSFAKMEKIINDAEANENLDDVYAFVFLKYDQNGNNMGNNFERDGYRSTMFNLYFKEGITGEKALVYKTSIRRQYSYEVQENEKFITEASLMHKIDLDYDVLCYNTRIMICEYQEEGYTKNIKKIFYKNPKGYYKYFKEIFDQDLKDVTFKKLMYIYKQFILFATLSNKITWISDIKGLKNKIIIALLYLPGRIATRIRFKNVERDIEKENNKIEEEKEEKKVDIRELIDLTDNDEEDFENIYNINFKNIKEDEDEIDDDFDVEKKKRNNRREIENNKSKMEKIKEKAKEKYSDTKERIKHSKFSDKIKETIKKGKK